MLFTAAFASPYRRCSAAIVGAAVRSARNVSGASSRSGRSPVVR